MKLELQPLLLMRSFSWNLSNRLVLSLWFLVEEPWRHEREFLMPSQLISARRPSSITLTASWIAIVSGCSSEVSSTKPSRASLFHNLVLEEI